MLGVNDSELLLAISGMLDKKLQPIDERFDKLEKNTNAEFKKINSILDNEFRAEFRKINFILENEVRSDIKLLVENYIPSASRYEHASNEHENMKNDIELLKRVVSEHSEKLQRIS